MVSVRVVECCPGTLTSIQSHHLICGEIRGGHMALSPGAKRREFSGNIEAGTVPYTMLLQWEQVKLRISQKSVCFGEHQAKSLKKTKPWHRGSIMNCFLPSQPKWLSTWNNGQSNTRIVHSAICLSKENVISLSWRHEIQNSMFPQKASKWLWCVLKFETHHRNASFSWPCSTSTPQEYQP